MACQRVEVAQDLAIGCSEPVASYCTDERGGCPSSSRREVVCAWLAQRGTPDLPWGGPVTCEGDFGGFTVEEGDVTRTYLFDDHHLVTVLEDHRSASVPPRVCVAGPPHFRSNCADWLVSYGCFADADSPTRVPRVVPSTHARFWWDESQ
jgi:hypothetical protein